MLTVNVPAVDWSSIFDDTLRTGRLFQRTLPSGRLITAAQHSEAWVIDRRGLAPMEPTC